MKKDPGLIFRFFLMVGDAISIVASFLFAYFFRTNVDSRPYYFDNNPWSFASTILLLVPIWWIILALLGLYAKRVSHETARLLAASIIGTMTLISLDFFYKSNLFPVRPIAIYATIFCFMILIFVRHFLRRLRKRIALKHHGTLQAIIIGKNIEAERLLRHIADFPEDGYTISAVIAPNKFIPKDLRAYKARSLKAALENNTADVIFQTDENHTEYVYNESVKHHLLYYYVPSEFSSKSGRLELIGETPAILVKTTPLTGGVKIIKRTEDICIGGIILLLALIPMIIIWCIIKAKNKKSPAIYSEYRLSRFNQKVKIYKFRSIKPAFSGLSPEKAFKKLGRADLIRKYRENGDFLEDDPRIDKFGHFLRATSLDELPQLINVLKGDISLVGPRALVPGELRKFGDRSLLLSVKSGLTGLAQVSGRRDISFAERRALDLYYVQNWSLGLDFQIILRTISAVLTRKGAK